MHKTITVVFSMVLLMTTLSVAQPPTITSFTPARAPVGTRVTINGTNFNTVARNNIVYFGATRAKPVWVENSTQLSVLVPPGATYQPISVLDTATMLTGYASKPFVVAFNLGTTQGIDGSSFETKVDFGTGVKPESVAIGDLDGDGKSDLVVANSNSNTVSVYRNISSSGTITGVSFAPRIDLAVGVTPLAVAIGDLDGTGRPEIVVVNYNQSSVSVLRNYSWPGTISFGARVNFAVGSIPYSIAIGDLDRDGQADLAVTNISSNTVSVLRNTTNQGALSFAARVTYATGEVPFSVAIGDLNGDAKPEMVVANYTSGTVSVFRNTASSGSITSASFAAKVDFAANAPHFVTMGDLDLDGRPDLALSGSDRVSILRNTTPSGNTTAVSFAAKVDFTTGISPYGVAITDLNGDGKPDLATVNSTSNTVSVLRNTSWVGNITTGSFSAKVDFNVGSSPFSLAIGDLDRDGKPELVTANYASNTISVLRNTLSSGPSTPSNLTATAGIEQVTLHWTPNTEDIAYYRVYGGTTPNPADTVAKVRHPLAVHTETGLSIGTKYYFRIQAVDIFGNVSALTEDVMVTVTGNTPPVITSFTPGRGPVQTSVVINGTNFNPTYGNNIVFFGATEAKVMAGTANQLTVTVRSGATYQPISVTDTTTSLTGYTAKPFGVTFGTGTGKLIDGNSLGSRVDLTASAQPQSVAIGDLDSDDKPDLVVLNDTSKTVSVYRNISSVGTITASSFAAKVDFATGTTPYAVAIGDLNGDSRPELVVANFSSNTVSVFQNTSIGGTGTITFAARVDFATGQLPHSVAIGDLDSDGRPDLVVANINDNTVSVLRNVLVGRRITTGSFERRLNFTTGSVPFSVAIGDLNGDRKPDLAVANSNSNTVSVLQNVTVEDSLAFISRNDFATSLRPTSVAIGDLDDDGMPDLAVATMDTDTVSVLRNTTLSGGMPSFASRIGFATGDGPVLIAIGNVNGDAKPDLVTVNKNNHTVSVLRNTASAGSITTSSFASSVNFAVGSRPVSVAIGDLDSDGKPEVVTANYTNTISILHNNLDVTPPAVPTGLTASVSDSQILLKWKANTEKDLAYYRVYRGTKASPSTLLATIHVSNIDLLDFGVYGTKYYYCISAVDSAGNESAKTADVTATPYKGDAEFRKRNTSEQQESYTKEVTIHPNPSAGPVQLTLPTADTAVISVLDLQERTIKQGQYKSTTVTLDLGDVEKGIYLIRIQQRDLVKTLRVIIY